MMIDLEIEHDFIVRAVGEIRKNFYKMDSRTGVDKPIDLDFIAESNMRIYVIDRNTGNKLLVGVNSSEDRFFWQPPNGGIGYFFFDQVYGQALSYFRTTELKATERTDYLLTFLKQAVTTFNLAQGYEPKK